MSEAPAPLFRNPDFTKLWVGETLSALGTRVSYVAYPLLVLSLTGSAALTGVVGFLRTLPYFALSLPAGVVADRLDRRRLMIAADVLGCVAMGSVVVALALHRLTFAQIAIVGFLEGTAALLFRTAEMGALPHIVAREQLSAAVATNEARRQGAYLAGPPLGGALFGIARALPFLVDAVSYLASAVAIVSIRRAFQQPRSGGAKALAQIREGLAWMWREPFLRTSELLVAGSNFATNALLLTLILVAKHQGASSTLIGAMLAIVSVGGLTGAVAAPRLRRYFSARRIVVGYSWVGVAVVLALVTTPPPLLLGLLFAAWTFFGPLWDAIVVGYRLSIVPDELQGRVESVGVLISFGGAALGPLAAGIAYAELGGRTTIASLAVWLLVLAVVGTASRALRTIDI